ncbi:hypothetical protein [Parvularcula marina]|uniref:hypothetical protein n=1 Tax=Parvularcula marina TaxID=2292771 RepID=UPI0035149E68
MRQVTRLLILISVAFLAARPVMACCLTGDAEPVVAEFQTETPPCHGETPASQHANADTANSDRDPSDCPGCFDCDAAIMQAHTVDDGALLTQITSEIPLVTLASRFAGFEHKPVVFKTGPPGDPPPLHHTPITLKQRLLI